MAPTKKVVSTPKASVKKSKDGIVKRPARGFHRFRNGVMNVAPKGGEKELVKNNQNSPLLRLPAELRHQIWEYVLCFKLLTMSWVTDRELYAPRVIGPSTERGHGTDLLRTCRQIYSETALLPSSLNTFYFHYIYYSLKHYMKSLRPCQHRAITQLQLQIHPLYGLGPQKSNSKFNFDFLPGLKTVRVVMENPNNDPEAEDTKQTVEAQLGILLAGRNVKLVFEDTHLEWDDYVAGWKYSAP